MRMVVTYLQTYPKHVFLERYFTLFWVKKHTVKFEMIIYVTIPLGTHMVQERKLLAATLYVYSVNQDTCNHFKCDTVDL